MLESAKQLYDEFLERQKHFRPEDRLEFIRGFLNQYCCNCGGIRIHGCWCEPHVNDALQPKNPDVESGNVN
jgi:hypothetical protein